MTDPDDRLRSLAEQIDSDAYRVDALAVADAILRRIRMEDIPPIGAPQSKDGSGTSDSND